MLTYIEEAAPSHSSVELIPSTKLDKYGIDSLANLPTHFSHQSTGT